MLSDEEKKAIEYLKRHILPYYEKKGTIEFMLNDTILNLIEKQSKEIEEYKKQLDLDYVDKHFVPIERYNQLEKEIEELKASHIMTHNKTTNTEKAKIFDVIDNSLDTYIEKLKPYWEQIMTKDEMTIDEALTIIDDMYQDRYKIMSQKTEKETIVDLSKMDYIKFTNLEWASVRVLREVQSLNYKLEKWEDKIKAKIEEFKRVRDEILREEKEFNRPMTYDLKRNDYCEKMLQSLLEKEE